MLRSLLLILGSALAVGGTGASAADAENIPAEVVVLSVLHQLHGEIDGYSFDVLSDVIESLQPDVICVELTNADLESRREQSTKQEYQKSLFPLLEQYDYRLVALEPDPPLYDELVGRMRNASAELQQDNAAGAAAFATYSETLYELIVERWVSPAAVNSAATDVLFESKHRFQNALFGPDEAAAWEGWNRHFLDRILEAAQRHPNSRILVLVGAEHGYWLRNRLRDTGVRLADTEQLLRALGF